MAQPAWALLSVACLLVASFAASGQVHRCTTPTGKVEFSDRPCSGSTTGGQINVRPNELDTSGSREQLLIEQNRRLQEDLRLSRGAAQSTTDQATGRTQADLQAEKANSFECRKAMRDLDVAVNAGRKGRDTTPEELAVYSACGIRVPDKTVIQVQPEPRLKIRSCDAGGCFDSQGNRYSGVLSSGFLRGPNGTCRVVGNYLRCQSD